MSSSEASRSQSPSAAGHWDLALHHTRRAVVKTYKGFRGHPIAKILATAGVFGAGLVAPYVGGWLRRVVSPVYQKAKEVVTGSSSNTTNQLPQNRTVTTQPPQVNASRRATNITAPPSSVNMSVNIRHRNPG